jgi:ferredoxin
VTETDDIRELPEYIGEGCVGCEKCVAICPGLALTLVDYRQDTEHPTVTIPYEFPEDSIAVGEVVTVLGTEGNVLGNVEVVRVRAPRFADRALLVRVRAPAGIAKRIVGIRAQEPWETARAEEASESIPDDEIVCRCERVTAGEIRALIRSGIRDVNHIKAITRAGMGACGSKTCRKLIERLFRQEGVPLERVTENTQRPLFIEVPLGAFAGVVTGEDLAEEAPAVHATDVHEGGM